MRLISAVTAIATPAEYFYSAANSEVVDKVLTFGTILGWRSQVYEISFDST